MAASVLIPTERRPITMPGRQPSENWMLKTLNEMSGKLDKSIQQGAENGEEIRRLRIELGLDGVHGRLPRLEEDFRRAAAQQDKILERVDTLEKTEDIDRGKMQAKTVITSILTSSAAAGALGVLAKMLGLIH